MTAMASKRNKNRASAFVFKPFSKKQLKVLTFWTENSPVKHKDFIIADGSVRSGKTISFSLSFVEFVMHYFNGKSAGMCSKSIGVFKRNVLEPLKQMLVALGYSYTESRSENYIDISKGNTSNRFYVFGGKDEKSQDFLQGITLCSILFDEAPLMPKSFIDQGMARCSETGKDGMNAKYFFSCNPNSPFHWFYTDFILSVKEKNGLYLHFTMDDNLTLSKEVKERYLRMYTGVFRERYIFGKWVLAEGLIYDMFSKENHIINPDKIPYKDIKEYCIGVDYGTGNATVFVLLGRTYKGIWYAIDEYYYSGKDESEQKTDLEYSEDLKTFINKHKRKTGLTFRDISVIVDPAANSFKTQLRRSRIRVKSAKNEVIDGIRVIASLLKDGQLYITTDCHNLIKEFSTYSWDEKAQLRGIDAPLKENDHCVVGSTLVHTESGLIPIKDLVGKTGNVYSYDEETGKTVLKRFSDVRLTRKKAKTIVLVAGDSEIILTPDHQVLTLDGWKEAQYLSIGEWLITKDNPVQVSLLFATHESDIYNMEVEDTHNFAVEKDGIIIHNCQDALRYGVYTTLKVNGLENAGRRLGI